MLKRLKFVFSEFSNDEILTRSAALSYYTALAMAPLVVILVWILSLLRLDLQGDMIREIATLVGEDGGKLMQAIINGANDRPDLSTLSGWIGILGLIISASVIFAQLQETLNIVFDAQNKKKQRDAKRGFVKSILLDRLFSVGMLLTFVFLSIVSLAISSALTFVMGPSETVVAQSIHIVVSLFVFTCMFAAIYKWMPDRKITLRGAMGGGLITSLLFSLGKLGIGIYLGTAAVGSAYGAAGSLIVLLVWVFYSSVVFFLGAEVSYAMISGFSDDPAPTELAERGEGSSKTTSPGPGKGQPTTRWSQVPAPH